VIEHNVNGHDVNEGEKQNFIQAGIDFVYCPECGAPVIHESGCVICVSCGWALCG